MTNQTHGEFFEDKGAKSAGLDTDQLGMWMISQALCSPPRSLAEQCCQPASPANRTSHQMVA